MMRRLSMITAAVALALAASGCSRSPRVNFYVMEPVAAAHAPAPAQQAPPQGQTQLSDKTEATATQPAPAAGMPSVVVGPVTLPELVDRPQLVVRTDVNRVEILEQQRWAEPLKTAIPRLIAQNLGRQLGSHRVSSYHDVTGGRGDYRVLVDLLRLDSVPGNLVVVEAKWSIRPGGEGLPTTGRSEYRERITGAGYDGIVAAWSRALALVSSDIAAAMKAQQPARH